MGRRGRRTASFLLMAAISAVPMGFTTIVSPAISSACEPGQVLKPGGGCAAKCDRGQLNRGGECVDAMSAAVQAIDPNQTPGQNLVNLQNLPPMEWGEGPLVETALVDEVPVEVGLPGIGVGINPWPDLSGFVPTLPAPGIPDWSAVAVPTAVGIPAAGIPALGALPPPQLPPLQLPPPPQFPPRPLMCGPQMTPFFTPCI